MPHQVLRQRIIDNFIVDFYCARFKLAIEIDGDSHYTEEGHIYDMERAKVLEGYGIKIIRFTNNDVMNNYENVCEKILELIEE